MSYELYDIVSDDNSKKNLFTKFEFLLYQVQFQDGKSVLPFENCTIYSKTIKIPICKTS